MAERRTPTECWGCGATNDTYRNALPDSEEQPADGSVGICFFCGAFGLHVVHDGQVVDVRPPTQDEWHDLTTDEDVLRIAYQRVKFLESEDLGPQR